MTAQPFTSPVEDSVPKVGEDANAVAVGENLDFQRKWWRFERVVWGMFLVILACDVLGLLGRGWLAKATAQTTGLTLDYERVVRAGTPSVMTLTFGDEAIHEGKIRVYVSDSMVRPLGAQRVSPQPAVSAVGNEGITYTFDATRGPAVVQIALEPSFPGVHAFKVQSEGDAVIERDVVVLP